MKYAAIDVGSNSVRLLSNQRKILEITTLGEGLLKTGLLKNEAMQRTADAIMNFVNIAKNEGADKVFVFATQAVRAAKNGDVFINKMKDLGVNIDLVSKEQEAELGFLGAYTQGTCAVLDIGGASSELAVGDDKGVFYKSSQPIGAVSLKDISDDREVMESYVENIAKGYGNVPSFDTLLAIGGTPTTFAAIYHELEPYDPNIVDKTCLTGKDIYDITTRIINTPYQERKAIKGLHPKKVPFAIQSGVLLYTIMKYLKVDKCVVTESDNLEGYIKSKT